MINEKTIFRIKKEKTVKFFFFKELKRFNR